jgi:ABC-type transport system substrate-binding protein
VSYAQTFDAILFGWRDVFPDDPSPSILLQAYDRPGTGNNFVSYYNQRVEDLYEQTKTVPNCDVRERAALYAQIQRIIQDDQPYVFLYAMNFMYAAWKIDGFDPYPNMPFWNVEDWVP